MNFAAQAQFTNHLAGDHKFGVPMIFLVINNHYGMTHRTDDEVMGVERHRAPRSWFCREQYARGNRQWHGPAGRPRRRDPRRRDLPQRPGAGVARLRYLSLLGPLVERPRNEYRTKEEEAAWKAVDPIETFKAQILENEVLSEKELAALEQTVRDRNARAAKRAAAAADPAAEDVIKYMYTDTKCETVPAEFCKVEIIRAFARPSSASTAKSLTKTRFARR